MKRTLIIASLIVLSSSLFAANTLNVPVTGRVYNLGMQFTVSNSDWILPEIEVGSIPRERFNTDLSFSTGDLELTQYPITVCVQSSGSWLGMEYIRIISPNATNLITLDNQVYTLNQVYYAGNNNPKSYAHSFLFEVAPKEIGYINGTLTFTATYRSGS